ncbi:hypothetical protein BRC81_08215 [Halobacteriales archaeon QS_1_68_20]|nr:MAG: hypothetical protein BRC81_08215 [Halobacteriales archaeon QS_1_68_20]
MNTDQRSTATGGTYVKGVDVERGAVAGASQVLGYFLLAIVGTFLFTVTFDVGPQLEASATVMGVLYPVVFGGAGGVLAAKLG